MNKSVIILIVLFCILIGAFVGSTLLLHNVEPKMKKTTTTKPAELREELNDAANIKQPKINKKQIDVKFAAPNTRASLVPGNALSKKLEAAVARKSNIAGLYTSVVVEPGSITKAVIYKFIDEHGDPKFELKINDRMDKTTEISKVRNVRSTSKQFTNEGNDNKEVDLNMFQNFNASNDFGQEIKIYTTTPINSIYNAAENANETEAIHAINQIANTDSSNEFKNLKLNISSIITAVEIMRNKIKALYEMIRSYTDNTLDSNAPHKHNRLKLVAETINDQFNDTNITQILDKEKPKQILHKQNNTGVISDFVSFFTDDVTKDDIDIL